MKLVHLATAAAILTAAPLPAAAEFLAPDWSSLTIEGVVEPDWAAGVREGNYIGMCMACSGTMMLQVQTLLDDGTGTRVHSGETTAQTFTRIGEENAARLGGSAAYYGTKAIDFAAAKGFRTRAMTGTGDYVSTYQLWSDGQQLIVKVFGKDQAEVEDLAAKAYQAAAPLTFR